MQEFLFSPVPDLLQLGDIPKVTRCLAIMAKMVSMKIFLLNFHHNFKASVKEFEDVSSDIPGADQSVDMTGH